MNRYTTQINSQSINKSIKIKQIIDKFVNIKGLILI